MNFLRGYLEAIKIMKTEREYSIKALGQFTRVQNLKAVQEGYDYFVKQLEPVPYPSVVAMQAVVDQIAETNPKAKSVDAKNYVNDRYLKRLEEEGFVKKIWGKCEKLAAGGLSDRYRTMTRQSASLEGRLERSSNLRHEYSSRSRRTPVAQLALDPCRWD